MNEAAAWHHRWIDSVAILRGPEAALASMMLREREGAAAVRLWVWEKREGRELLGRESARAADGPFTHHRQVGHAHGGRVVGE